MENEYKNFVQRLTMPLPELEAYYRERRKERFEKNTPFDGLKLRRVLHPVLVWGMKVKHILGKQKVTILGDKRISTDRPVVYAATHIGWDDIDISITTRELARMIKIAGLNFTALPDEEFDPIFGGATGAAHIFGATGGVMEAALRTVVEILENKPAESVDYKEVRGIEGIKEATYTVAGTEVKVAVVSGTANAGKLLSEIKEGKRNYHFIEVMACPGGCVNGGGQPLHDAYTRAHVDLKTLRAKALYSEDEASTYRKSHENPIVKKIYDEYLGEPGSHKAHHLLHTTYVSRGK